MAPVLATERFKVPVKNLENFREKEKKNIEEKNTSLQEDRTQEVQIHGPEHYRLGYAAGPFKQAIFMFITTLYTYNP